MTWHPKEFPDEWNTRIFVWSRTMCAHSYANIIIRKKIQRKIKKKKKNIRFLKFHSFGTKKKFHCSFFFFGISLVLSMTFFALRFDDNKFSLSRSKNILGSLGSINYF